MPYKSKYNRQTVKKGGSRTPAKVMGNKGKPAKILSNTTKKVGKAGTHKKFK